jgi:monoamine oxidase
VTAKTRFPVAARVGIVGGGASGIAAAHALRELGRAVVTVFEREPCVGGKCSTLVHGGRTYELGAGIVTSACRNVRALMREADVRATPQRMGLLAGVRDAATRRLPEALRPRRWPRVATGSAVFALALMRHRRLFEPGFEGADDELAVPFADWCRATHCEAVEAALEPWVTGFGYGYLRDHPAVYVLKYATLFGVPRELLDVG